jgi:hypothetical protein
MGFAGITPDGTLALSSGGSVSSAFESISHLYSLQTGTTTTASGLGYAMHASAFSPNAAHVAFGDLSMGANNALATVDFNQMNLAFSNYRVLYTPPGGQYAIYPSWLPTSDAVLFELQTVVGSFGAGETRTGSKGQLWWVDTASLRASALTNANGTGYLPTSSLHPDDTQLNYEPSVSPTVSGGYLWVAFTTRRLYGNVATIDPFLSDPRNANLMKMTTTKKIWIAAIDASPTPGTDPSHPAFYLPNQELPASNGRPLWAPAP